MKIKLNKTISLVFGLGYAVILLLGWPNAADASEKAHRNFISTEMNQLQSAKPAVSIQVSSHKSAQSPETRQLAKALGRTPSERLAERNQVKSDVISVVRRSEVKKTRSVGTSLNKSELLQVARAESPMLSSQAFGFSFYSAVSYLNVDLDNDGFYSDFTLEFDADYDNGFADVYAVIYYSQNGGPWIEFTVTDDFVIFSDDANDFQSITSVLNFGFPSSEYDFLIDLYESGVDGIVATIAPQDTSDLFALPLEDEEHENASNQIQISYVATTVFNDFDGDAFFTDLTLEYDIDTFYVDDLVYSEIVLTNIINGTRQYLSTDDFILGNQTEFVDLTFNSGYIAGWYDVRINLINAYTGEVIATAGPEFASLESLPIESINNDSFYDVVVIPLPPVAVLGSSGSMGWLIGLVGFLGLLGRNRILIRRTV